MRVLIVLTLLVPAIQAATIHGCVKDASGHPVPNATLQLAGQTITVRTDAAGNYQIRELPKGSYSVRASASNSSASSGPFQLDENDTKKIDLILQPDFFDEPNFVVAGVTAGNYQGGHGSDVVLRSTDALRKDLSVKSAPAESVESIQQALTRDPNNSALHHQLGDAEDLAGHPLVAVREYQRAAELDATEPHLFDWAAELLSHHADAPSTEVFAKGNRLYPNSVRMLLGLATAWYARGSYDQAAKYFFAASDLDPANPTPYLLLAKARATALTQSPAVTAMMERFAHLHPEDPQANYLYAVSLWTTRSNLELAPKVEALLRKAAQLDPKFGEPYLALGAFYSDLKQFPQAIESFQQAIHINPSLDEAHYRLAQTYRLTGQKEKALEELTAYQRLSAASTAQANRERNELQQFVIELRH